MSPALILHILAVFIVVNALSLVVGVIFGWHSATVRHWRAPEPPTAPPRHSGAGRNPARPVRKTPAAAALPANDRAQHSRRNHPSPITARKARKRSDK